MQDFLIKVKIPKTPNGTNEGYQNEICQYQRHGTTNTNLIQSEID
jgi:hypothetical protein